MHTLQGPAAIAWLDVMAVHMLLHACCLCIILAAASKADAQHCLLLHNPADSADNCQFLHWLISCCILHLNLTVLGAVLQDKFRESQWS